MKIFVSSLFILGGSFKENYFGGHDAMKGSRNKLKILIVSDMVHGFRYDAKTNELQFQTAFFHDSLNEIHGPCQKIFFQLKNSHRISKKLQSVSK